MRNKLGPIVGAIVLIAAIALAIVAKCNRGRASVVEVERAQEACELSQEGLFVATPVEDVKRNQQLKPALKKLPSSAKPFIAVEGETKPAPTVGKEHIKLSLLGARTEAGNVVVEAEAWAYRDNTSLFGGRLEPMSIQVEREKQPPAWLAGPSVGFSSSSGWLVGGAVSLPSTSVLGVEFRPVVQALTNGRELQGNVSILIGVR